MADPDYEFMDGFDKYGLPNDQNFVTAAAGEWTSIVYDTPPTLGVALSGLGCSVNLIRGFSTGLPTVLSKTMAGNYARVLGGYNISSPLLGPAGIQFGDGATNQLSITINTSGRIEVRRGDFTATLIATSTQSVSANSVHWLEWDITFNGSTGIIKIWLDGILTSINLTGQNTISSANPYFNTARLATTSSPPSGVMATVDHFYLWCYTASGGSETPCLSNPIIETQPPNADSVVTFTPVAGVLGVVSRVTTTTNSPAANTLLLRPYTPEVSATINSVSFIPNATSATAKFKGVIYSDSAGAPGTLLSSGIEVVGTTSGSVLLLSLVTPQALTAGTQYWIGFINDTSLSFQQSDAGTLAYRANNTYTSGAPGTAPAMTSGQPSFLIYGNTTGMTSNWGQVNENPALGNLSYNKSSTVGNEDLYSFPALVSTPSNIYSTAIKANVAKSDSGTRTVDLRTKSGATSSSGSAPGQAALTSYGFLSSYFRKDPNTGSDWTPTNLNAAKGGLKVAS